MSDQQHLPLVVNSIAASHSVFGTSGQPILALHGWGASADLIAPLGQALSTKGFQVFAPDLPGFGQTPPPHEAWSVFDYANWADAYMTTLGLEKVYFFGHSFGGRLGLIMGADRPDRLHKMVLADAAGVMPRRSTAAQIRLRSYKTVRDSLKAVGLRSLSDQLRNWYTRAYGSPDYQAAGVLRDSFVRIVNQDLLPHAARIAVPTLLLWGEADEDTPLWQGQLLEKTIPDAGLVTYPNAGHYSYLERLPEAARTIAYFFSH